MKNKAFKLALTIVIVGALVFGASFARAQTTTEDMIKMLQSLIQMLLQMVAQLQAQLAQRITTTTTIPIPNIRYSCQTAIGTILTNWYSTCILAPNGTFNSLAECQKVCGTTSGCTDSDGGKNYNVKGTVIYGSQTYTDSCDYCTGYCNPITGNCPPVTCGAVKEYYCENGVMKYETHDCETGTTCQDGACKATTSVSITVLSPNGGKNAKWEKCVKLNGALIIYHRIKK